MFGWTLSFIAIYYYYNSANRIDSGGGWEERWNLLLLSFHSTVYFDYKYGYGTRYYLKQK